MVPSDRSIYRNMFRRQNLHKAGRSISSPWIVRRRSVIQPRIVVQLLVSIQDQLLLRIASKLRFPTKVAYQMTADTWYMCNCLSKAVALFMRQGSDLNSARSKSIAKIAATIQPETVPLPSSSSRRGTQLTATNSHDWAASLPSSLPRRSAQLKATNCCRLG